MKKKIDMSKWFSLYSSGDSATQETLDKQS